MNFKWNERYKTETYFYGKEPNDFLKEVSSSIPPHSKILCLAEGEGRNAVFLATLGHEVYAIDQSEVGLSKLQQLAKEKNVSVKTEVADLNTFDIGTKKWDVIVSIWCHLPSELRKHVHQNCVSGLKEGGLFILESYTPNQLQYKTGGPDNIDLLMSAELLKRELFGLKFSIIQEKERDILEGIGHIGKSAVVQVLAKK